MNSLATLDSIFNDKFNKLFDISPFYRDYDDLKNSDIFEDLNQYIVKIPIPGFSKDQVEVNFNSRLNRIEVSAKNIKEDVKGDVSYCKKYAETKRMVVLNKNISPETFTANIENGLLTIKVDKKENQVQNSMIAIPVD